MILSESARAAAKKAQLARLAAKGSPDYPKIYANQPAQIRRAIKLKAERKVFHDAKMAVNAAATADADAAAESFGNLSTKKGDK